MRDSRPGHIVLANLLADWLLDSAPRRVLGSADDSVVKTVALLDACSRSGRTEYHAAQVEALALLDSVKTYADALYAIPYAIPDEASGEVLRHAD